MNLIIALPENDNDFATRLMLIKSGFSRQMPKTENINPSRESKRERGIWQRRYWEHWFRDETDFGRHVDWQFSTIHKFIKKGVLTSDWGCADNLSNMQSFGER